MKRVTQDDINKMRDRGYDTVTIEEARVALIRTELADKLIKCIEDAFNEVVLGDGISLKEAQGLDDYADTETCARIREADEKEDWRKIPAEELNRCNSSLSFFDTEGMRFHLPAYMTAELLGEYRFGMAFSLTHERSRFTALNTHQRKVVREFLLYLKDDPDYEFEKPNIERSLEEYWI